MLTNDNNRLLIFNNGVAVDKNLPKWVKVLDKADDIVEKVSLSTILDSDVGSINMVVGKEMLERWRKAVPQIITGITSNVPTTSNTKPSWKDKFFKKRIKKATQDNTYKIDVIQFFESVKLSVDNNQQTYTDRVKGYLMAIKQAEKAGQTALLEKMQEDIVINKYESILYAEGVYKVVTEQQMVDFVKACERGLRLDYVKNFMRIIPDDVIVAKEKADALEIFDNYVVLHYDPETKAYAETKEEIKEKERKRKDPILFGVINGSNKLYYIADWVDDVCDLTLEQFAEKLQKSVSDFDIPKEITI